MDKYLTDNKFWQKRAKNYDKLHWTKNEDYLNAFVKMCRVTKQDNVLDLGTGTGTIAYTLAPYVRITVGIDKSIEMLHETQKHNRVPNTYFLRGDVRYLPFLDNSFEIVTSRMVFHHLLTGLNRAVAETYRVLKPGGVFCLSEGVPPCKCVDSFYKAVFLLKEKRRTFYPEDLQYLFKKEGFKDIKVKEFIMRECSIKNWLNNAGNLTEEIKKQIYDMHINLHREGKNAYNMKITPDDCFVDMKFIIISGRSKK